MSDLSGLKIVEIGNLPYLERGFPGQVASFLTAPDALQPIRPCGRAAPTTLHELWRLLHDPETSLIVCRPLFTAPWNWRWLVRLLFDRRALQRLAYLPHAFGPQLLRWQSTAPLVIWDDTDMPLVNRDNFFLLDRCRLYFKRELPPDRWRLFMKTGHSNLPTKRFRELARYRSRIDKIRPISLGLPLAAPTRLPPPTAEKTTDIFFAGTVEGSSSVRLRGLAEVLALRERGFVVDIPEERLPLDEFYRRCQRAWLIWSPEGYGWDCFRHYEAALCGAVPLINQPTIERHQPLRHGEHALYYDVEDGELTRAAIAALADKPRLEAMGRAARAHTLAHHTPAAIARYIVQTALAAG
jgi:hypothetical protein